MHVVQEAVAALVDGAHWVKHSDLVETLAGIDGDPGRF